jgi:hypothetical protein
MFTAARDSGSWSLWDPIQVLVGDDSSVNRHPRVESGGGYTYVAYEREKAAGDRDIFLLRSGMNGTLGSWTSSPGVAVAIQSKDEFACDMALVHGSGGIVIPYVEHVDGWDQIRVAYNANHGDPGLWERVAVTGDAVDHGHPQVATEPSLGKLRLAFWTVTGIYFASAPASSPSSWTSPMRISDDMAQPVPAYGGSSVATYPFDGAWYAAVAWTDGRNGLPSSDIYYTTDRVLRVDVTIDTFPTGLRVELDGVDRVAPYTFSCVVNTSHALNASSPQALGGVRNVFKSWSNGEAASHMILCAAPARLVATFETWYETTLHTSPSGLDVVVDGEIVTAPVVFWWPAGSDHSVSAPSPQRMGSIDYVFVRWSDGGLRNHAVNATGPVELTAVFASQPTPTSLSVWWLGPLLAVVVLLLMILVVLRRRRRDKGEWKHRRKRAQELRRYPRRKTGIAARDDALGWGALSKV